jgi:hypothetical protein
MGAMIAMYAMQRHQQAQNQKKAEQNQTENSGGVAYTPPKPSPDNSLDKVLSLLSAQKPQTPIVGGAAGVSAGLPTGADRASPLAQEINRGTGATHPAVRIQNQNQQNSLLHQTLSKVSSGQDRNTLNMLLRFVGIGG